MNHEYEIECHFETKEDYDGGQLLYCVLDSVDGKPMSGGGFCEVDDDFLEHLAFMIALGHAIEHATGLEMEPY